MSKKENPFKTGLSLSRKFGEYAAYAEEQKRLPNMAGFAAYARLSGGELSAIRTSFAKEFDIIRAALIDAAINSKIANSGAIMEYIERLPDALCSDGVADDSDGIRVVCAHSVAEDGQ